MVKSAKLKCKEVCQLASTAVVDPRRQAGRRRRVVDFTARFHTGQHYGSRCRIGRQRHVVGTGACLVGRPDNRRGDRTLIAGDESAIDGLGVKFAHHVHGGGRVMLVSLLLKRGTVGCKLQLAIVKLCLIPFQIAALQAQLRLIAHPLLLGGFHVGSPLPREFGAVLGAMFVRHQRR
jgi:hypothetical protein